MSQTTAYIGNSNMTNSGGIILHGGIKNPNNSLDIVLFSGNYQPLQIRTGIVKTKDITHAISGSLYMFAFNNNKPLIKGGTLLINYASSAHALYTTGNVDTSLTTNIHQITYTTTILAATAIREGKFDLITGKFNQSYPLVSLDDFSSDRAADASRLSPGRLVFCSQKHKPNTVSYKQKNG